MLFVIFNGNLVIILVFGRGDITKMTSTGTKVVSSIDDLVIGQTSVWLPCLKLRSRQFLRYVEVKGKRLEEYRVCYATDDVDDFTFELAS